MPLVDFDYGFAPTAQPIAEPKVPTFGETVKSVFALESDVVNAVELMTRPRFEEQQGWALADHYHEAPEIIDNFPKAFMGIKSQGAFDATVARIKTQQANRDVYARAGVPGILLGITAGVLSPTNFIPLIGTGSRGLRALVEGLASGAAVGAIQGGTLSAAQETRTTGDFLFDVGASTILGGILGGVVGSLTPLERANLEAGMARGTTDEAIPALDNVTTQEAVPIETVRTVEGPVTADQLFARYEEKIGGPLPPAATLDVDIPNFGGSYPELTDAIQRFGKGADLLDWISKNSPRGENKILAQRLKDAIGDVDVQILEKGTETYKFVADVFGKKRTGGLYWNGSLVGATDLKRYSQIFLPKTANETTILHELIHAATDDALKAMQVEAQGGPASTAKQRAFYSKLTTLMKKTQEGLSALETTGKDLAAVLDEIGDSRTDHFLDYMLSKPSEFLTVAMTDRGVQNALKRIKVGSQTIWSQFMQAMREFLGLTGSEKSILDEIMEFFDQELPRNKQPTPPAATAAPGAAGSQAVRAPGAGRLKGIRGSSVQTDFMSKFGGKITQSPVVQVIQQKTSATARWMMAQLSNAGLRLEGNRFGRVTALGGPVENRVKQWYRGFAEAIESIDDSYHKYLKGAAPKGVAQDFRNVVAGNLTPGKMDKFSFREEVARAMRGGDEYKGPIEAKEAAARIKKSVYDPLLEEALDVGLLTKEDITHILGDPAYLNRSYDTVAIERNKGKFIDILAENFMKAEEGRFVKMVQRLKEKEQNLDDLIEDLGFDATKSKEMRAAYQRELDYLSKLPLQEHADKLDELITKRRELLDAANETTNVIEIGDEGVIIRNKTYIDSLRAKAKELEDEIKQLRERGGEQFETFAKAKARARKRLRNLDQSIVKMEEKYEKTLKRLNRVEELQINTFQRVIRSAEKLSRDLSKISESTLRTRLAGLRDSFQIALQRLDKNEAKFKEIRLGVDPEDPLNKLLDNEYKLVANRDRLNGLAQQIDDMDSLLESRDVFEQWMREMFDETTKAANDLNHRRSLRRQKLEEKLGRLDPENVRVRIEEAKAKRSSLRQDFVDKRRIAGADDIDVDNETANFAEHATELAREVTNKILGTFNRLPAMDIIQGERGPELARLLNIPSAAIEEFLHNDIEFLMRAYVRTMGADIEMMRKFGSVDGSDLFRQIDLEFEQAQRAAKTEAEKTKVANEYRTTKDNLLAVIGRLRHTWGIPNNPTGAAARLARVAQNINTLRFMGSVVVSSIPDMARVVMRYGLRNTMRHAFIPMINDLKNFRLSVHEAKLAGTALDVLLHTRAHLFSDVFDSIGRSSKFERGLEYATSRIGMVAAFDYWTSGMKQLAAAAANAEFISSIETLMKGQGDVGRATELLSHAGIDGERASNIWALISRTPGGGRVNDVYLPNTEDWLIPDVYKAAGLSESQAKEALTTYRAALAGEIDSTIITPGVERPLWMDGKSLTLRLIAQFRSFSFASSQKTVMAGLQQGDMAMFNGAMFSLALGAMSYYIWATTVGGEAYEEMLEAGPDKWADEAIQRSGLQAAFAEVQKLAETIPAINQYASFSGTPSTRRGGGDLLDAVAGPTADLAERLANVVAGIDDPTQSTVHTARTLLPYQNVFWLRQLFDQVEEAAGSGLPERRGQ